MILLIMFVYDSNDTSIILAVNTNDDNNSNNTNDTNDMLHVMCSHKPLCVTMIL